MTDVLIEVNETIYLFYIHIRDCWGLEDVGHLLSVRSEDRQGSLSGQRFVYKATVQPQLQADKKGECK